VLLSLLALPASDSLPSLRWNLHLWNRLRKEHRIQPDAGRDAHYGTLVTYLPVGGPIGLMHSGRGTPEDRARTHYLLQYALAPRRLVESTDYRFVIVAGDTSADSPLRDDPHFELIASFGDDLSVFRRIDR